MGGVVAGASVRSGAPVTDPTPTDLAAPLNERLLRASIGGCTCRTKSPDIQWHDPLCHYRLFCEALGEVERLNGIYLSAVHGRREMRATLRKARGGPVPSENQDYRNQPR